MAKGGRVVYCGDASRAAPRLQAEANAALALRLRNNASNLGGASAGAAAATPAEPASPPPWGAASQAERVSLDAVAEDEALEGHGNPGDVILDLACSRYARALVRAFETSDERDELLHVINALAVAAEMRGVVSRDFPVNS